ncbi:MAG: ATP synthase F1 subunit delta [Candidatus Krumholzibacteria bacterium]|nr:ATP synthase F1 subunit delta [Candidatus Krumholzibacteria bacterium]MDH4337453.1 ATP synthase F1 subunit delta [Candidatus Krumholzibacteria bacterium]MDH5270167.1 ATP synthase F1 subunit delta [Candidatus Krumholzibacteria bacterium]
MVLSGVGKRYAVALFNAARAEDVLDQVYGDAVSFARVLKAERSFKRFLESLQATSDEKKDLVVKVIGDRASGLFVKFVLLLIDKKRMANYAEIEKAFEALYDEERGIVEVALVTAVPLDLELERKAKATIEKRTGKTAKIVKRVDPGVIGGVIMIAGDQIIDGSIRNHLAEMRQELLALRVR